MPKIITISDSLYDKLITTSRNINYSILNEMTSSGGLKLLGVFDEPILTNGNDILSILHLISSLTGKNINLNYDEILPPTKRKKEQITNISSEEKLPRKASKTKSPKKPRDKSKRKIRKESENEFF